MDFLGRKRFEIVGVIVRLADIVDCESFASRFQRITPDLKPSDKNSPRTPISKVISSASRAEYCCSVAVAKLIACVLVFTPGFLLSVPKSLVFHIKIPPKKNHHTNFTSNLAELVWIAGDEKDVEASLCQLVREFVADSRSCTSHNCSFREISLKTLKFQVSAPAQAPFFAPNFDSYNHFPLTAKKQDPQTDVPDSP
jgi:hypothetical protein